MSTGAWVRSFDDMANAKNVQAYHAMSSLGPSPYNLGAHSNSLANSIVKQDGSENITKPSDMVCLHPPHFSFS